MVLYGYGSYGISLSPIFSSSRLSLLDRGIVYAVAYVRGGGELGEDWREQGRMMQKMNTFTDFIDCAEHLVGERYTSTEGLVIQGGSAGGLLVCGVANMRPALFKRGGRAGAVRGHHEHHARRDPAADDQRIHRVGQSERASRRSSTC